MSKYILNMTVTFFEFGRVRKLVSWFSLVSVGCSGGETCGNWNAKKCFTEDPFSGKVLYKVREIGKSGNRETRGLGELAAGNPETILWSPRSKLQPCAGISLVHEVMQDRLRYVFLPTPHCRISRHGLSFSPFSRRLWHCSQAFFFFSFSVLYGKSLRPTMDMSYTADTSSDQGRIYTHRGWGGGIEYINRLF